MTVASNQPSLALADDVENLVVKNAQSKKVDSRSTKNENAAVRKDIQQKNLHVTQPEHKASPRGAVTKSSTQMDLGFPYKAQMPAMKTKSRSIPDERTMRAELDAFLKGESSTLRGYDAF